jgi:predicted nucleic acid-binding protein
MPPAASPRNVGNGALGSRRTLRSVVLDANVLIAAVRPDLGHVPPGEGSACSRLMDVLERGELHARIPAAILSEVVHVLARNGIPRDARSGALERWATMPGRLDILPLDGELAVEAGEYRQAHYHRERMPISYIDCFCVALARRFAVPLVTFEGALLRAPGLTAVLPSQVA